MKSQCLYSVYTNTWPYKQQADWNLGTKYVSVFVIGSVQNVFILYRHIGLRVKSLGTLAGKLVTEEEEIIVSTDLNIESQVALCHCVYRCTNCESGMILLKVYFAMSHQWIWSYSDYIEAFLLSGILGNKFTS